MYVAWLYLLLVGYTMAHASPVPLLEEVELVTFSISSDLVQPDDIVASAASTGVFNVQIQRSL
jgi:hypothetical protein